MAGSGGKRVVQEAATQALEGGWAAPDPFNIVNYFEASLAELYRLIEWSGALCAIAPSRGKRREARKVSWALRNALLDCGEEAATISAAEDFGAQGSRGTIAQLTFACVDVAARRRAEVALGAVGMSTCRRAVILIGALTRLESALKRIGVSPVASAGERDARWRATYDGVERAGARGRPTGAVSDSGGGRASGVE